MDKDDIIRMAKESGFEHIAEADYWHPLFERFANLVAAEEREACAVIAFNAKTYLEATASIRARGQ